MCIYLFKQLNITYRKNRIYGRRRRILHIEILNSEEIGMTEYITGEKERERECVKNEKNAAF